MEFSRIDRNKLPLSGQENDRINDHISDLEQVVLSCLRDDPGMINAELIVKTGKSQRTIINDRTYEIFSYDVKDNTLNLIYLDTVGNDKRGELHLRIIDEDHLESLDSKNVWTRVTND